MDWLVAPFPTVTIGAGTVGEYAPPTVRGVYTLFEASGHGVGEGLLSGNYQELRLYISRTSDGKRLGRL